MGTMMECKNIDERMVDYLYEELDQTERAAFEEHLRGCERCRCEVAALRDVRQQARALPLLEPPAATDILMQAAKKSVRSRGILQVFQGVTRHPAYAMAAAFVVVGGIAGWQLLMHGRLPEAPAHLPEHQEEASFKVGNADRPAAAPSALPQAAKAPALESPAAPPPASATGSLAGEKTRLAEKRARAAEGAMPHQAPPARKMELDEVMEPAAAAGGGKATEEPKAGDGDAALRKSKVSAATDERPAPKAVAASRRDEALLGRSAESNKESKSSAESGTVSRGFSSLGTAGKGAGGMASASSDDSVNLHNEIASLLASGKCAAAERIMAVNRETSLRLLTPREELSWASCQRQLGRYGEARLRLHRLSIKAPELAGEIKRELALVEQAQNERSPATAPAAAAPAKSAPAEEAAPRR